MWAGELADAEGVEDHLFACDHCAAASAQLDRLIDALLSSVPPVLTRGLRDRLEERGLKILNVMFEAGARGEAYFASDLDILVFELRAEIAIAKCVDLVDLDGSGQHHFSYTTIPLHKTRGLAH